MTKCIKCGSTNVEQKLTVYLPCNEVEGLDPIDERILEAISSAELWHDDHWCNECKSHVEVEEAELTI